MQHTEGAMYLGLRVASYSVRVNDDGRGWTARGEHPEIGNVVLGVRAFPSGRMKAVFGKRGQGYRYQFFIQTPGKPEYTGKPHGGGRPKNTDVYHALSRVLASVERKAVEVQRAERAAQAMFRELWPGSEWNHLTDDEKANKVHLAEVALTAADGEG